MRATALPAGLRQTVAADLAVVTQVDVPVGKSRVGPDQQAISHLVSWRDHLRATDFLVPRGAARITNAQPTGPSQEWSVLGERLEALGITTLVQGKRTEEAHDERKL